MTSNSKKVALPVVDFTDASVNPDTQTTDCKGIVCNGCELFNKERILGAGHQGDIDIMFVSESPSSWSVNNKQVFYGRGGRIIREAWKTLKFMDAKAGHPLNLRHLRKFDTYAIQCQVETGRESAGPIPKPVIDRCSLYLKASIVSKKPKIILAFGSNALKALGYKGEKFMEVRGRLLSMEIGGHSVQVLPTFSTKHLVAKTGLYTLFHNDFLRAIRLASGADQVNSQIPIEEIVKEYKFPKTVEEVAAVCDEIINYVGPGGASAQNWSISFDTETNTVNPHRADAKVLCISFAWDDGKSTAIPMWHDQAPWTPGEFIEVLGHVRRVLESPKPKAAHNFKFDGKFLELRHGLTINAMAWDSMLAEHLLREDQSGAYSLKVLGRSYFPSFANYADKIHELAVGLTVEEEAVHETLKGVRRCKVKAGTPGFDEGMTVDLGKKDVEQYLYGAKKDRRKRVNDSGYERVPLENLLTYAAIDTDLTRRLCKNQAARLRAEGFPGGKTLMKTHCVPASRTLGKMEFKGMRVDLPYVNFLEEALTKVVADKKTQLEIDWDGFGRGEPFNPNSTQHVGHVLFSAGVDFEGRKPGEPKALRGGPWAERNTKSQQWKTDKKTLRAIVEHTKCRFSTALLDHRAAHKALSGFIHDIKILAEYDGFLHTNFLLHGTSTGRLASNNLNMQNLPSFLAGFNIKKIFLPDDPETEVIVNVDWRGAEIRIFTAYARDPKLIDALNNGLDVHSLFVHEIYGIPYDDVANRDQWKDTDPAKYKKLNALRTNCKRVVFGILYGAMAKKIAETAGISEDEAQKIIDGMFTKFPSLKGYMDETVAEIHTKGYVETLLGRRRRFPLQGVNGFFRGQAERRGKNMKIQSTSSDIVIGQLVELDQAMGELGGRLCITVHDSIVATVKKKYVSQLPAFLDHYCVKRVAQKYPWLPVAFACDIEVGPSYGELSTVDRYLKAEAARVKTPEEMMNVDFEIEAVEELRTDDEERAEAESIAAALGAGGGAPA